MYVLNSFMGEVYEFTFPTAMSTLHSQEEDSGLG